MLTRTRDLKQPGRARATVERFITSMRDAEGRPTPALNFWRLCVIKNYVPTYSQVTVGSISARVGTRVDVKCVDAANNNAPVLIENKVGYSHQYHAANAQMCAPYADHSNCPYNQHQVQLAVTTHMYDTTFPRSNSSTQPTGAFVWRHDEAGICEYELEPWARQGAAEVLRLAAHL